MGFLGIFKPNKVNIILAIILLILSTAYSYYFLTQTFVHPSDPFKECGTTQLGFPVPFYYIEVPCYDIGLAGGLGSLGDLFNYSSIQGLIIIVLAFLIDVFIWYIVSAFISYGIVNLVKGVRK